MGPKVAVVTTSTLAAAFFTPISLTIGIISSAVTTNGPVGVKNAMTGRAVLTGFASQSYTSLPSSWRKGPLASFADALKFASYRNFEASVGTFLEFVCQATLQPGAMMMVRPLVKMLIPQRPEAVHR